MSLVRFAVAAALTFGLASPVLALTAQQEKMKTCNTDAKTKSLKGPDRKTFMSECLKSDSATAEKSLTAQQEKMKTCNADATTKNLKGKERRTFMSTCLKG
jgi:hypothetical protein